MRAMRRTLAASLALSLTLSAGVARAQSDEPPPPGGGPMKIDMNARPGDEAPPPPPRSVHSDGESATVEIGKYQLGARVRGIFVSHLMLQPYLAGDTGTSMESWSVGLEFIYRRTSYDVVTSLDFSWLDVHDGNWLGSGHDPSLDTHYLEFRNLSFLSADVSIIGHHKFLPWLELRYGGGLGLGWVPGDVLLVNNGPQCTLSNAKDPSQCYPTSIGPINGKPTAAQQATLNASNNGQTDTNVTPHLHVSGDKPPVMAVVNLLVGLRFYPHPHVGITVEVGFRDAIFTGVGFHYLF
jgi:hypothetical protein